MKCPICHSHTLHEVSLYEGLTAHQCNDCAGHWISSEHYWKWLDHRKQPENTCSSISLNFGKSLLPVTDNKTANFCADCARLMTKARVGHSLDFYLDRCSHCHGVWLDKNEWENLQRLDLHHQIHYMFSSAWQFSVRQEQKVHQKTPA